MKAQRLVAPGRFEAATVSMPELDSSIKGQVLLKVSIVGICGSDLSAYLGRKSLTVDAGTFDRGIGIPGYPSHEVVGMVAETSDSRLPIGTMVVGWATHKNALVDYVVTGSNDVIACCGTLRPIEAVIIQPLACVLQALHQIGDLEGKSVAIIGQGAIGLLFSHAAKSLGARHVTGVDRIDRSACADAFLVDETVNLSSDQWALGLHDRPLPDIVIEAVGHQVGTLGDAIDAAGFGGTVFYFGIPDDFVYPISIHNLLRKNLSLKAGYVVPDLRGDTLVAAKAYLLAHPGLADALVSNTFAFDDCVDVYRAATVPAIGQRCQWPFVCAHRRPAEMPAGGHGKCPVMANRSAHRDSGGVGHFRVVV